MSIGNTKKDGSGAAWWQRVDGYGRALVQPAWTHVLQSDTNLNDSDKEFTVPALKEWDIQSIYIEYTATATAGTRRVIIEIQNGSSDVVMMLPSDGTEVIATEVYHIMYSNVSERTTDFPTAPDGIVSIPAPRLLLPAGYVVRIYDVEAVAAAADDMIVHIRALQRDLFEEPA